MKNVKNHGVVSCKCSSILSQLILGSLFLFTLFFSQHIFSKTVMSYVNMKTTDTIKQKKIIVDLKEPQKMAQYPGGLEKFYAKINAKFSNSEIDYEGFDKINVSFVIEMDGSMSAIIVNDQTMSKSMKKSIELVLKSIKTKWSPAIIKDQPVRTRYELPLVFND